MFDRRAWGRFAVIYVALCGGLVAIWVCDRPFDVPTAAHAAEPAAQGQEKEAEVPPALTRYLGREIAQTMHFTGAPWLTRESRDREEDCARMLKALEVKEGMTICDLGCGNGFYTLQLAKLTGPKGLVYGVDIQPEMLGYTKDRAAKEKIENIKLVQGSVIDPFLPAGEIDLILLVDVYHEFSHPVHMLKAIRDSLKPDGLVVLVEFRAEDPKVPIKPLHKMSKKQVEKELKANGFRLVRQYDELPWQHMMFFGRQDAKESSADKPAAGGDAAGDVEGDAAK